MPLPILCLSLVAILLVAGNGDAADPAPAKKVVFIAGPPSHGYGTHQHHAGCLLLAKCLQEACPGVQTTVHQNGWPQDPHALDGADAIVLFADGGGGNPLNAHLKEVDALIKKGVGLVCLHYAVQVDDPQARACLKDWIGGFYETHWSVNPTWKAEFTQFPEHPIARGLRPFAMEDEWYYHMRFSDNLAGVTPILSAVPPESTRQGPDGPHSGNPTVRSRKGLAEHVAWARQRPEGGRGFGFTGGHWHWNWAHDQFRKLVLNGIAWTAGIEIPSEGLASTTPPMDELEAHQDFPAPADFDAQSWRKRIEQWNQ